MNNFFSLNYFYSLFRCLRRITSVTVLISESEPDTHDSDDDRVQAAALCLVHDHYRGGRDSEDRREEGSGESGGEPSGSDEEDAAPAAEEGNMAPPESSTHRAAGPVDAGDRDAPGESSHTPVALLGAYTQFRRSDKKLPLVLNTNIIALAEKVFSDGKFSVSFYNLIGLCGISAVRLLSLVLETFPCFRDTSTF